MRSHEPNCVPRRSEGRNRSFIKKWSRFALLTGALLVSWCVCPSARATDDILFEDFETQNNPRWTATGDAFAQGSVEGTLSYQLRVLGYHASRLINSHVGGNHRAQGEYWSQPFTSSRHYIRVHVGGGNLPGQCEVRLEVGGVVRRASTGRNSEELLPEWWDVQEWQGQPARIGIIDHNS